MPCYQNLETSHKGYLWWIKVLIRVTYYLYVKLIKRLYCLIKKCFIYLSAELWNDILNDNNFKINYWISAFEKKKHRQRQTIHILVHCVMKWNRPLVLYALIQYENVGVFVLQTCILHDAYYNFRVKNTKHCQL